MGGQGKQIHVACKYTIGYSTFLLVREIQTTAIDCTVYTPDLRKKLKLAPMWENCMLTNF